MSIPAGVFGVVSRVEKTPELSDFWFSRYQHFLKANTFQLRPKTIEILDLTTQSAPFTPTGEIVISGCLKQDGKIDTSLLQDVVYTAVRFLDACIDAIPFEDEARFNVDELRKIGIGITGLEGYLSEDQDHRQEKIDILGEQFAKLVYRASETLAQEKGVYGNYDLSKATIEEFEFERYEHKDTGAVKDGATLVREGATAGWLKVPRRNSVLLALPTTREWKKWSDRTREVSDAVLLPNKIEKSQPVVTSTRFEVGELVKVTQKHSLFFGRVGQIVEVNPGNPPQYKLATYNQELDTEVWVEDDLGIIQTDEVINKLDRFVSIQIVLVILNKDLTKVLSFDNQLPSFYLLSNQDLLQQITSHLSTHTESFVDIVNYKIVQTQFTWEKRAWSVVVSVETGLLAKGLQWITCDSPTLGELEKQAVAETVQNYEQHRKLIEKIAKLEAQIEEQKTLLQIQKRESLEFTWMREFGILQGGKQVTLASGYTMELSIVVDNGQPKELQLRPIGNVPTALVTIMKLVEVAVSGRVHDATQLAQSLSGLAKIARSTNDAPSLEIVEAVQKTLGLTIDQN